MLSSKDQKDVHVKMLIKKNTVAGGHHQDGAPEFPSSHKSTKYKATRGEFPLREI